MVSAAAFSLAGGWFSLWLAPRLGAMDHPDPTKIHGRIVPRLGGIGIVAGVTGALLLTRPAGGLQGEALRFLAGAGIMVTAGLLDDVRGLGPWTKLSMTAAAASCLVLGDVHFSGVSRSVAWAVSVVIVVGVSHSLNLIDGLDGLATGVAAIASLAFLVLGARTGPGLGVALSAALLGGALGFLPWNWHPARTFMGDVGSLFLGYTLAAILLLDAGTSDWSRLVGSVLILGVPLGDMGLTLLRRGIHRRPLFSPDPFHFYNVLMRRGLPHRQTVLLVYAIQGAFAALGVVVSSLPATAAYLLSGVAAVTWLVVGWRIGFLEDWQRLST